MPTPTQHIQVRPTAFTIPWRLSTLIGASALSVMLGILAARSTSVTVAIVAAILAVGIAASLIGHLVFPLALIVLVPLIPVAGDPPIAGASAARLGIIAVFLAGGLLFYGASRRRLPSAGIRSLVIALLILSTLGILTAIADGSGIDDFLQSVSLMAGQPLVYAGVLTLFAATAKEDEHNRIAMLRGWAAVAILEGLYVAVQFATGAAYNPLYGFWRAQGTTGADFLGAFAAISFFGALALRSVEQSARGRAFAWIAVVAAGASLLASTSRGPLVGLVLGLVFLLFYGRRYSVRPLGQHLALVLSLLVILVGGLYATENLWLSRLNSGTTTTFDRPATWSSGLRIAADHPVTGVGPAKLITLIQNIPRYKYTPYGETTSVPHDMWIYALAVGGLPYGLAALWLAFVFVRQLTRPSMARRTKGTIYLKAALVAALPGFVIDNIFTHPEVMIIVLLATALLLTPPQADALV